MTNENMVNLTCRWLDEHHSEYIHAFAGEGTGYVSGRCQTDLRHFLNWCIANGERIGTEGCVRYGDAMKEYGREFPHLIRNRTAES